MFKQSLILTIFAFALISCASFEEDNHVIVLTKDNFDNVLSSYENVLVEFYAPWCGHCQKLEPELAKAAEYFKEQGNKVRIAKVDATVETELAEKFEVTGFPTLSIFINGKESPYSGGRSATAIVGWIKKKTEHPSIYIEKLDDVETIVKKADYIVLYYGDEFDHGLKTYKAVASEYMDIPFFHTVSEEIVQKYNPDNKHKITMIRSFEDPVIHFEGDYTQEEITAFVMKYRHPRVVKYEEKWAKTIFGEGNLAFFVMIGKGEASENAIAAARAAAEHLQGKAIFALCDTDEEICQKVVKYFGMLKEEVPSLYLFKPADSKTRAEKYLLDLEEIINKENILKFYEDFKRGALTPVVRSEEVPDENDDLVKTIVGKSFRDIVHDENKDVLVFYTESGCGGCREYLTEFNGLAKLVLPIENLILGSVLLDKNQIPDLKIDSIPKVMLYPRGDKTNPIVYEGRPDIRSLYQFFKDKLTVDFDASAIDVDRALEQIRREAEEKEAADELARVKLQELEAGQRARDEAQAAAEARAQEHARQHSQAHQAEKHTPELTQKPVDTDL